MGRAPGLVLEIVGFARALFPLRPQLLLQKGPGGFLPAAAGVPSIKIGCVLLFT